MRKILAALMTLVLLVGSAALAEPSWTQHDFGDFTLSYPDDIMGSVSEERVENQPFVMLYQDYDPIATFNKSMNILWSGEVLDLDIPDTDAYFQQILDVAVMTYEMLGFTVTDPQLLSTELGDMMGKPMLAANYQMTLDYANLGIDDVQTLYTAQVMVPDAAFEGTYTFTITTDDWSDTQLLMDISNTVAWN